MDWNFKRLKTSGRRPWPAYDPELVREERIDVIIQVNGKMRDKLNLAPDVPQDEVETLAMESPKIQKWIAGRKIVKLVFAPNRLLNVVLGD